MTGSMLRERTGEHIQAITRNTAGCPAAKDFKKPGHRLADMEVLCVKYLQLFKLSIKTIENLLKAKKKKVPYCFYQKREYYVQISPKRYLSEKHLKHIQCVIDLFFYFILETLSIIVSFTHKIRKSYVIRTLLLRDWSVQKIANKHKRKRMWISCKEPFLWGSIV